MGNVKLYEVLKTDAAGITAIVKRLFFYVEVTIDRSIISVKKLIIPDFIMIGSTISQLRVYSKGYYIQIITDPVTNRSRSEIYTSHSDKRVNSANNAMLLEALIAYLEKDNAPLLDWLFQVSPIHTMHSMGCELEAALHLTLGIKDHKHIPPCVEVCYESTVNDKSILGNLKRTTRIICIDTKGRIRDFYESPTGSLVQLPDDGDKLLIVRFNTMLDTSAVNPELANNLHQVNYNLVECVRGQFIIDPNNSGSSLLRAYTTFAPLLMGESRVLTWLLTASHDNQPTWIDVDKLQVDNVAGRPFVIPSINASVYLPVSSGTRVIILDDKYNYVDSTSSGNTASESHVFYVVMVRQRNTFIASNRALTIEGTTRVANVKRRDISNAIETDVELDIDSVKEVIDLVQARYPTQWEYLNFKRNTLEVFS